MELKDREQKLDEAIDYMFDLEPVLELALTAEAEAEYANEMAFSDAMDKTSATNDQKRKADALLTTRKSLEAYLKAKSASKMIQIKMKNAQTAVSARQSMLSSEVKIGSNFTR